jgi:hypothetical protein
MKKLNSQPIKFWMMKLLKKILIKKTCRSQKIRMKFEKKNDPKQKKLQLKEWVPNFKD